MMNVNRIKSRLNGCVHSRAANLDRLLADHETNGAELYSYNIMNSTFDLEWAKTLFEKIAGSDYTVYQFKGAEAYNMGARGVAIHHGVCLFVG
jgi:hypothetical protein